MVFVQTTEDWLVSGITSWMWSYFPCLN